MLGNCSGRLDEFLFQLFYFPPHLVFLADLILLILLQFLLISLDFLLQLHDFMVLLAQLVLSFELLLQSFLLLIHALGIEGTVGVDLLLHPLALVSIFHQFLIPVFKLSLHLPCLPLLVLQLYFDPVAFLFSPDGPFFKIDQPLFHDVQLFLRVLLFHSEQMDIFAQLNNTFVGVFQLPLEPLVKT